MQARPAATQSAVQHSSCRSFPSLFLLPPAIAPCTHADAALGRCSSSLPCRQPAQQQHAARSTHTRSIALCRLSAKPACWHAAAGCSRPRHLGPYTPTPRRAPAGRRGAASAQDDSDAQQRFNGCAAPGTAASGRPGRTAASLHAGTARCQRAALARRRLRPPHHVCRMRLQQPQQRLRRPLQRQRGDRSTGLLSTCARMHACNAPPAATATTSNSSSRVVVCHACSHHALPCRCRSCAQRQRRGAGAVAAGPRAAGARGRHPGQITHGAPEADDGMAATAAGHAHRVLASKQLAWRCSGVHAAVPG